MKLYKRGPSWWITYMVDNQRIRISANTKRREEAQAFMSKLTVEIFEGRHFPDKKHNTLSVQDLGALWLSTKGREKKSRSDDEQRFRAITAHFGANRRVSSIKPKDAEAFVLWLREQTTKRGKQIAAATVNHHLKLLRAALNNAAANGHDVGTTAKAIRLLPLHNARERLCTPAEYKNLMAHAYPKLRFAIVMGYWTAMRLGEISQLSWQQIDLVNAQISLKASQTKTRRSRTVPLAPEALEEIRGWPRALGATRLIDVDKRTLSPAFARLCRKLQIEDLRFHDFRHTALTRLRRAGADILTIAAISGHEDLKSLQRYSHVSDADKQAAISQLLQFDGQQQAYR
jgi:integrase